MSTRTGCSYLILTLFLGMALPCFAGTVRILKPEVESRFSEILQNHLSPQGFASTQDPLHWLSDVQVNERGRLKRMEVGSLFAGRDVTGSAVEIHCDSIFVQENDQWNVDITVPANPSCMVIHTPHPSTEWDFVNAEWFAHSGNVDRRNFQILYDAFADYLVRRGYSTPSWTRDAWILRAAVDSQLNVDRLWIFASALIDRESLNVEKRADCHGEVHRISSGLPGSGVSEEVRWSVFPNYTCRIQLYRYRKTCYGTKETDCEYDWEPCDGAACGEPTEPVKPTEPVDPHAPPVTSPFF